MVARRRQREGRGYHEHARAAQRQDPVELRKPQVVADRQAQLQPRVGLRHDDLIAGLLELGLAVGEPVDRHVEHVDLAIERADLAVGGDVHRGVVPQPVLRQLGERAGHQFELELPRALAGPRHRRTVDRLRTRVQLGAAPEQRPLLRKHHKLSAARRRLTHEPIGRREVRRTVRRRIQLHRGDAQRRGRSVGHRNTGRSVILPL